MINNLCESEYLLLESIQELRKRFYNSHAFTADRFNYILIKNIISVLLPENMKRPNPGEFDALVDDIENYVKNTVSEFVSFVCEK